MSIFSYRSNNLKPWKKHLISTIILIAYSVILIEVMVFKNVPTIRLGAMILKLGGTEEASGPANFLPFKTILPYLLGDKGWFIAGTNLVGNIALLMPIGFLAPLAYPNMTWKKALALGVTAGLTIEAMQTALHVGIFDIDDVILNALGVIMGYGTFVTLTTWVRLRKYKNIIITALIVIAVTAAAFYAIYPKDQHLPVIPDVGAGSVFYD